jgi:maltose/moltooligosaccharide transporter
VLVLGEALVDRFADGSVVGGAPFNVARSLAAFGVPTTMVTRIGRQDDDGASVLASALRFGLHDGAIQRDDVRPTGVVTVVERGKPRLSFWQIVNMNVGFFGIQFSFGLQQSNMSPIYSYLGADEASLPLLWLAGPMTGLLVQPVIGAMSDRTVSRWGRRTPYFLIGAILCSLGLLADAVQRHAVDGCRPAVDPRRGQQRDDGALPRLRERPPRARAALAGLPHAERLHRPGADAGYLAPSILVWLGMNKDAVGANHIPQVTMTAFLIGAVLSFTTVWWSVRSCPSCRSPRPRRPRCERARAAWRHAGRDRGRHPRDAAHDAAAVVDEAVPVVRDDVLLDLHRATRWRARCSALPIRRPRAFATPGCSTARSAASTTSWPSSPPSRWCRSRAARRRSRARGLPGAGRHRHVGDPGDPDKAWLFVPMIGVGLAWASIMGNPYVLLAGSIPPERAGVYMGIFNMFIVIPMLIQMVTLPLFYQALLGGDPANVIRLAGALLLCAAVAVLFVDTRPENPRA